jgi:spore coat protein U-like protein
MKLSKTWIAAALAGAFTLSSAALQAADSHTITVNATVSAACKFNSASSTVALSIDPAATAVVTQPAAVTYRCTKGTTPSFALASGSTGGAAGGDLTSGGGETIAYTFGGSAPVAGSGMGAGQDKTYTVTVSVDPANAANVSPAVYSDTIAVTINP